MADQYRKPYIDSAVFIGWIKGEVVDLKNEKGEVVGKEDRGRIGEHVLGLAEANEFPAYISALTIAEVHKKRHKPTLNGEEDSRILDYFRSEFIKHIDVDRTIGEEANRLCRRFEGQKLLPNDAIHLACALRAGCDVLLSWDGPLNSIQHEKIRIEKPRIIGQARLPLIVASGDVETNKELARSVPSTPSVIQPPTAPPIKTPAATPEPPIPAPSEISSAPPVATTVSGPKSAILSDGNGSGATESQPSDVRIQDGKLPIPAPLPKPPAPTAKD